MTRVKAAGGDGSPPDVPDVDNVPGRASEPAAVSDGGRWSRLRLPGPVAYAALGACGLAVVLWVTSLGRIDTDKIGDTGLISVLPWRYFVVLALLSASMAAVVTARLGARWYALHVVLLVVVLHATLPLVYDAPRFAYVYKHLGVVDLVSRFGSVDRTIDVYNNWPGFFLLNAYFRQAAGLSNSLGYTPWAPVFFNLVSVLVLLFAYRSLVADPRARWMGVWVFLIGNWAGQDYLAPQAFGFLLALAILGSSLRWLHGKRGVPWVRRVLARVTSRAALTPRPVEVSQRPQSVRGGSATAVVLVLVLFSAVVISHQLTPILVTVGVAVVIVVGRRRPWWLPLVLVAMTVAWFGLVAGDFLAVHTALIGDLGHQPDTAVAHEVSNLGTSAGQALVARASRLLSAALWALGAAGLVLRWRNGHRDLVVVALAIAPLPFLATVDYGGEILLRVYLFGLPWVALLGGVALARLCHPAAWRRGQSSRLQHWGLPAVAAGTSLALLLAFCLAAFGQEKANRIRRGEVDASAWFYGHAPDSSLLMLVDGNFPARLEGNYGRFDVANFLEEPSYRNHEFTGADVPRLIRILQADTRASMAARRVRTSARAYVAFSRSQLEYADLYRLSTPRQVESLEVVISSSPRFMLVYHNNDARVYEFDQVVRP